MEAVEEPSELGSRSASVSYTVLRISIRFQTSDYEFDDEYDPLDPSHYETQEIESRREVRDSIIACLAPVYEHLVSIGCIRADRDTTPTFYLVIGSNWTAPLYFRDTEPGGSSYTCFGRFECELANGDKRVLHLSCDADYLEPTACAEILKRAAAASQVGCWGGPSTVGRLPAETEDAVEWLSRVAATSERLDTVFDRLSRVGYDLDWYSRFFAPEAADDTEWLVEGIIGFGAITLLVGSGSAGKSSACHELLSATNAVDQDKSFLGQRVTGRYLGVLLCGEETNGALKYRQERHAKLWTNAEPLIFDGATSADLRLTLQFLESLPGDRKGVLVVDPAQTFIDGDDTKSFVVSDFYAPLQAFARRRKWAVVVVAHLVKGASKTLAGLLQSVKGSTVHTDRARMVIGMLDRGNFTVEVGPLKHNYPEGAWLDIEEGRFYRRDPETFTLVPVNAGLPKAPATDAETLSRIHDVIARLNAADNPVYRTGAGGLYKLRIPELRGLSRNAVEAGVLTLLDAGRLINTSKGLVAVAATPFE